MKVLPLHYNWDEWWLVFELNYPVKAELWQMKLQRSSNSTSLISPGTVWLTHCVVHDWCAYCVSTILHPLAHQSRYSVTGSSCGLWLMYTLWKHSSPSISSSVQGQCDCLIVWFMLGVHSMKHSSPHIAIHTLLCLFVCILNYILAFIDIETQPSQVLLHVTSNMPDLHIGGLVVGGHVSSFLTFPTYSC